MSVTTRDQANQKLKEVALLQAALAVAMGRFDRVIARVKEKLFPNIGRLKTEIANHRAELELWANEFRAEFGGAKTLKLEFGALQFRSCPPSLDLLSGGTWDRSLKAIQERAAEQEKRGLDAGEIDWAQYIRWTPSIDAQLILHDIDERNGPGTAKLPRAHLREIGLKMVEGENFLIKPDPQSVKG